MGETGRRSAGTMPRLLPAFVAIAAVVGSAAPGVGRAAGRHGAIETMLAVLVFSAGSGMEAGTGRRLTGRWDALLLVSAIAAVALPIVAWGAAHLVPPGPERRGVLALGVAPTEVAAVAITSAVGGAAGVTVVLLAISTVLAVGLAGPVLGLLAGGSAAAPTEVIVTLVWVVGLPLVLGAAAGATRLGPTIRRISDVVAVVTVTVLAWVVASQIEVSASLVGVVAGVTAFLIGTLLLSLLLARGMSERLRSAVILSVSMRDFAVAAGITTVTFGSRASGPLGIYGIGVLGWGGLAARYPRLVSDSASARAPLGRSERRR